MKVGVLYRKNRNIEFQKKLGKVNVLDDAYDEAYMHTQGLKEAGYEVEMIEWINNPYHMVEQFQTKNIDLVFNVSSYQEAQFLEVYNIPYVGSSTKTIALDKVQRKIICAYEGVNTAEFKVAKSVDVIPNLKLSYPVFVKPISGRGSAGIDDSNIVKKYDDLYPIVKRITENIQQDALIEKYIDGREFTVGIIGYDEIEVLPIVEIKYSYGKTNSFLHKMNDNEIITCPAEIDNTTMISIQEMAKEAYRILDIKDFGRIDIMLDQFGKPYFLEVNTFAGLNVPDINNKAHIGYMGYMALNAGYSRAQFLKRIVTSAIKRYEI